MCVSGNFLKITTYKLLEKYCLLLWESAPMRVKPKSKTQRDEEIEDDQQSLEVILIVNNITMATIFTLILTKEIF